MGVSAGPFIMHPQLHGLYNVNNGRFSDCSKNAMSRVVNFKRSLLERNNKPVCGNGIVEEGEPY